MTVFIPLGVALLGKSIIIMLIKLVDQNKNNKNRQEPDAQRNQMVNNFLALILFVSLDHPSGTGSRAATLIGDKVL